jgi:futalosine hydrolase
MARRVPTLVLVPTRLELELLAVLGGFPRARVELVGFGPLAAAARTAGLLAGTGAGRALLVGIGGSLRPEELPVGAAASFAAVRLEGLERHGFAQWEDAAGRVAERLPLAGARGELLTVCAASASPARARARRRAFPRARVEDMEGFGAALACRLAGVPLVVVRGVSNLAGERERRRWDVRGALAAARVLALEWLARAEWSARR